MSVMEVRATPTSISLRTDPRLLVPPPMTITVAPADPTDKFSGTPPNVDPRGSLPYDPARPEEEEGR